MLDHDPGWTFVPRLRGRTQRRAQGRMVSPTEEAEAQTELVGATPGKVNLRSPEARNKPEQPRRGPGEPIKAEAEQEFALLRRGEGPEPFAYDILTPMASSSTANDSEEAVASPDGLSAFVARVLDQLTLTAWLPAGFLTASVAILLQFRADKSTNVLKAIRALTIDPVRVLVLIIPLLVLATVVTQAFSFEAIRTLEGYWRRRGPASIFRTLMIRRQVHRKKSIAKRRLKAAEKAFSSAEPHMLRDGVPLPVINAMKAQALRLSDPAR